MALTTDDVVAIQQLYARYNHAVDAGDGKAFAAAFVDEGLLNSGLDPVQGRPALAAFATQVPTMVPGIRHVATNIAVDGSGDDAAVSAYLHVYAKPDPAGPVVLASTGVYRDQVRRENGEWLFVERVFTAD
jgi:uncharacterized protein (TIGR02246 family)